MDVALLILRLVIGSSFIAHGSRKLFGWFDGPGLAGTGAWFERIGFRPGILFAFLAGMTELSGGLLFGLGLLGPFPAALILSVMVVAIVSVHVGHGFFASNNGVELPLLYITGAVVVAFAGPGAFALDNLLGLDVRLQQVPAWLVLAIGLTAALGNVAIRRPAVAPLTLHRTEGDH